jgi:polysaccharide biosynthesis protein PslG
MLKHLAAVVAVGVCFAASALPAQAAPNGFFGISKGHRLTTRDIGKMESTGVRTVRFPLFWASAQPHPGAPRWGVTDQLVGNLAAHGIRPVPFIYGSPSWVTSTPKQPPVGSARSVQAWRTFLTALAKRYGPGGAYWSGGYRHAHPGAAPQPITAWQIWNEPNLRKFFPKRAGIRKYAALLKYAHNAIKAVDPGATIVLAGMPGYARPTAWDFLGALYRLGGVKPDFDAVAVHPYSANLDQFKTIIDRIRGVMSRHGDASTPLWLTEVGWGSAPTSPRWPINKGPAGQKRMLERSFRLVLQKRSSWHVDRLFWFDWRDPKHGGGYCSFCDSSGLLDANHNPKPAYHAYANFAQSG